MSRLQQRAADKFADAAARRVVARRVVAALGILLLLCAGTLEMTWPRQGVLSVTTVLLAVWPDRSSSSCLVTLTLMTAWLYATFRCATFRCATFRCAGWRVSPVVAFFGDQDLSQAVPAVSPSADETEVFLTLMGHFGAATAYPTLGVSVEGPYGLKTGGRRDDLLMGKVEDQIPFGVLDGRLPVQMGHDGLARLRLQGGV